MNGIVAYQQFVARSVAKRGREHEAPETLAADFVEDCVVNYPEWVALYESPEFREVVAAITKDDSNKTAGRLMKLLHVLLPYAKHAALSTAYTRTISDAGQQKAADLIRKAADAIGQSLDRPKWDLREDSQHLGPYFPHGIEGLARSGALSYALRLIADAVSAAQFDASPISGLDQNLVAKKGPTLNDPERAIPGYLARNIFAALPENFPEPYATISALLGHIGVKADPHSVARYIKG